MPVRATSWGRGPCSATSGRRPARSSSALWPTAVRISTRCSPNPRTQPLPRAHRPGRVSRRRFLDLQTCTHRRPPSRPPHPAPRGRTGWPTRAYCAFLRSPSLPPSQTTSTPPRPGPRSLDLLASCGFASSSRRQGLPTPKSPKLFGHHNLSESRQSPQLELQHPRVEQPQRDFSAGSTSNIRSYLCCSSSASELKSGAQRLVLPHACLVLPHASVALRPQNCCRGGR